jgi:uracil-DNA glycosylase family protein
MSAEDSSFQYVRSGHIQTTHVETIAALRAYATECISCPLYRNATQTVFGEGPSDAEIMLVGEQPGEQEDMVGLPFVGPAGKLLDRALDMASMNRDEIYLTNAVKHFKWKRAGSRKLHQTPTPAEVRACYPWLASEIRLIQPLVIVCLGATATRAVLRRRVTLKELGDTSVIGPHGGRIFSTYHPSAILRLPDPHKREIALESLVRTLSTARASTLHIRPSFDHPEHPSS